MGRRDTDTKRWIVRVWNRTTVSPVHSGWRHVKLWEGAVILHEDLSFLIVDVIAVRTYSILGLSRLYRHLTSCAWEW
jgi:hypothetical protein